jgi:ElaB/YqjD/DUF883 family membrane-anchored ribosome-binding protein
MDSTFNQSADAARDSANRFKNDAANSARNVKDTATGEFKNLISDVEDLVSKVSDLKDPEITKLRNKVQNAIATARDTISSGADTVRRQASQAASSTDDFVRDSPWQAIGIAALVGVAVGFLAASRRP